MARRAGWRDWPVSSSSVRESTVIAPLIEYRRSTRAEGLRAFLYLAGTLAGFACFAVVGIYPDEVPLQVCFLLLIGGVGSLLCIYALQHLLVRGEFIIRIDETAIEQILPVWGAGDSFRILIVDVEHVERVNNDGMVRLVIVDRAENRFELTVNYGNPLRQIAEVLESLNVPFLRL